MKKIILLLSILFILCTSCRKSNTCVCTILQPNIPAVTSTVVIDNTTVKAFSICTAMDLTVVNTATTTCVIAVAVE